jgi:uncharacterized membrane protein YdjX (TVP38/TMEM64 family)
MKNKGNVRKLILFLLLITTIILLWVFDVFSYFQLDRIHQLIDWIHTFGPIAPIIFIVTYIISTVFFLPGFPLTLLASVVFGPVFGAIWVSIGSTIGATFAFIIGRYLGREAIVSRFSHHDMMKRIDEGVKKQGWKMVAITRLVPLFPFNVQNYIYGLTDIPLGIYVVVSWLCMIPATIGYTFLAGAIIDGNGDAGRTLTYVGIGIGFILFVSIIGSRINEKIKKEQI